VTKERKCWLVGTSTETGASSVVEAVVLGDPVPDDDDGLHYVVRVGSGCGVLHGLPVEKVHFTRLSAEQRLAEVLREDAAK
jgi:hypothetical protein